MTLRTDIATDTGLTETEVDRVLTAFTARLVDAAAAGERIRVPGLLTVDVVQRRARTARHPRTKELIELPARRAVKLTPGPALKAAVRE